MFIGLALGPIVVHRGDTSTVCGNGSNASSPSSPAHFKDWSATIHNQMFYYLLAQAIVAFILLFWTLCGKPAWRWAFNNLVPWPSQVFQRMQEKSRRPGWFGDVTIMYLPPSIPPKNTILIPVLVPPPPNTLPFHLLLPLSPPPKKKNILLALSPFPLLPKTLSSSPPPPIPPPPSPSPPPPQNTLLFPSPSTSLWLFCFAAFPNQPHESPSLSRDLETSSEHTHTRSVWKHLQEFFQAAWKSFHNIYFVLFLLVSGTCLVWLEYRKSSNYSTTLIYAPPDLGKVQFLL